MVVVEVLELAGCVEGEVRARGSGRRGGGEGAKKTTDGDQSLGATLLVYGLNVCIVTASPSRTVTSS